MRLNEDPGRQAGNSLIDMQAGAMGRGKPSVELGMLSSDLGAAVVSEAGVQALGLF